MTEWDVAHDGDATLIRRPGGAVDWQLSVLASWEQETGPVRLVPFRAALGRKIIADVQATLGEVPGFEPLVAIVTARRPGAGLSITVRAGGLAKVEALLGPSHRAALAALLEDPDRRAGWAGAAVTKAAFTGPLARGTGARAGAHPAGRDAKK